MHRLSRSGAIAATASLVAVTVLAGCGKSHDEDTKPAAGAFPSAAPSATQDVSSLTWDLTGGEPVTFDPVKIYNGSDLLVSANLCEALLTLDASGSSQPGLATSVDTPDDTTFVVHLRDGVSFSDGKPMTVEDVVFSLDRVRDPDSGSYWGYFAQNVTSVTATDASTVTIKLSKPDAIFRAMLATPMAQVVEKAYVEQAGDKYGSPSGGVMCTGPYTLDSWKQGSSITLKANPDWWGKDEAPQRNETVKFTFVTDDSTITSALLNGDIDGAFNIPRTTLSKLTSAENGHVYMGPSTSQMVLVPTQIGKGSTSDLANIKVREAFAKSIDYAGILSSILHEAAQPLRAAAPPGAWGYSVDTYQAAWDKLSNPTRDIAAAKQLVEESGVSSPELTLAVPAEIPEYVTLAETIQSNAAEAGIKVTLKPLPSADFSALYSSAKARDQVDVFLTDWYADIPDPTELYLQFGIPGGVADFGGYNNPQTAAQLEKARATLDDQERASLTTQAQATLTADLVWIPLAYPLQNLFLSDKLGGAPNAFPSIMYSPWLPGIGGR